MRRVAGTYMQDTGDDSLKQDSSSVGCFQHLLALHALTAADPSVAAPAADAQRFVRCLAPYVSELSSAVALGRAGRMSSGACAGEAVFVVCALVISISDAHSTSSSTALCDDSLIELCVCSFASTRPQCAHDLSPCASCLPFHSSSLLPLSCTPCQHQPHSWCGWCWCGGGCVPASG